MKTKIEKPKSGMKSLAKKSDALPKKANDLYYPTLRLDMTQITELKNIEIGDKIMILCEAKISGKQEYGNGEKECTLDLLAADIVTESESEDMEDK